MLHSTWNPSAVIGWRVSAFSPDPRLRVPDLEIVPFRGTPTREGGRLADIHGEEAQCAMDSGFRVDTDYAGDVGFCHCVCGVGGARLFHPV